MACDTAQSTHRKQVPGRGGWDGGMEGWRAGCRDGGMQGRDALDGRQQARLTQDPQEHGREESAHFMTLLGVLGSPPHARLVSPAPSHSQGVS